jgi:hypothetical protein
MADAPASNGTARTRARLSARRLGPFVGRDRELADLTRRLDAAQEGDGKLVQATKVTAVVTLDESGHSFTGRSVVQQYDGEGNLIGTAGGPFLGTRIVPDPV